MHETGKQAYLNRPAAFSKVSQTPTARGMPTYSQKTINSMGEVVERAAVVLVVFSIVDLPYLVAMAGVIWPCCSLPMWWRVATGRTSILQMKPMTSRPDIRNMVAV